MGAYTDIVNERWDEVHAKARQGDAFHQHLLGMYYLENEQRTEAYRLLRLAAAANISDAQFYLGGELMQEGNVGEGVHWMCCAARKGHAIAKRVITKWQADADLAQDIDFAFQKIERDGIQYRTADDPEPATPRQAAPPPKPHVPTIEELTRQADRGDVEAQYQLGKRLIAEHQSDLGIHWLRTAAKANHTAAQLLLSEELLESFQRAEGLHWLCCVHLKGEKAATERLNELIELDGSDGETMYQDIQNTIRLIEQNGVDYEVIREKKQKIFRVIMCVFGLLLGIILIAVCSSN